MRFDSRGRKEFSSRRKNHKCPILFRSDGTIVAKNLMVQARL
jgi:hypothetical protein